MTQQSLLRPMAGDVVAARAADFVRGLTAGRPRPAPAAASAPAPTRPPAPAPAAPAPGAPPPAPAALEAVQIAAGEGCSHPALPPRNYTATREAIPTACGRLVIRELVEGYHRYQLLEPVLAGATYGETKTDRAGRTWGLARTRRPPRPLADFGALVDHELEQTRRTVTVLRATVEELGLRDAHGRPGGVAECIYESRGDVLLMTDPAAAARRFRDQRGAR